VKLHPHRIPPHHLRHLPRHGRTHVALHVQRARSHVRAHGLDKAGRERGRLAPRPVRQRRLHHARQQPVRAVQRRQHAGRPAVGLLARATQQPLDQGQRAVGEGDGHPGLRLRGRRPVVCKRAWEGGTGAAGRATL
jgi:hypothetical protein